jgi:hypothetical protein
MMLVSTEQVFPSRTRQKVLSHCGSGEMLCIDQSARVLVCMIIGRSDNFLANFVRKLWKVYQSKTVL